jgi:phage I-like protein
MNPDDLVRLRHNIDLTAEAGKAPPSEFRIFAAGKIETTKGVFLFDDKAAEQVMASVAEYGNDYAVDYDHGMGSWLAMDPAESGKAAGWFKPELRGGELWASQVTWTPKATEKLSAREYRYTSPAFRTEKEGGRISELVNVALTNIPATKKHPPLMASQAGSSGMESKMKTIALALSLAAEATEAEVLSAVTNLQSFASRILSEIGAKSQAEAFGILSGWKGNAAQIALLSAKVDEYKAKEVEIEIEGLIAKGKADGKITPSSEPEVRKLAKEHGPNWIKGMLAVALAAPKPLEEPAHQGNAELTPEELAMCQRNGFDPKTVVANKKQALSLGTYPTA